ncbi:hypothetical protein ACFQH8_20585 [Halomicroarcula sp. GCM10025710]
MAQIDHKQPTTTFDLTLRAASDPDTVQSISNAFTSLSGPYYGIEGKILDQSDKPFSQLCHARQNRESALSGLLSNRSPIIVVSPDGSELRGRSQYGCVASGESGVIWRLAGCTSAAYSD